MKKILRSIWFALLLAGAAGFLWGCATDDPDPKPWNPPQNWQGGFPSTINQGR
ncbi:MAG TPA: hypothetical protein VN765_00650 [Candidatus Acidoferrum sp.]|nr:hypothetical protein [Candidatus Acidoferrum sp.]